MVFGRDLFSATLHLPMGSSWAMLDMATAPGTALVTLHWYCPLAPPLPVEAGERRREEPCDPDTMRLT